MVRDGPSERCQEGASGSALTRNTEKEEGIVGASERIQQQHRLDYKN